ncbi:MAG: SOS response-associated peptidase family protein [Proteobacteria bacterium]|nr:SOS response-associated peptidase family protein [Pseudomonadota bacterium]
MCNLYTVRLSRDEVAGLLRHRQLIGTNFRDPMNVYPNGDAPVMVAEGDGSIAFKDMRWGFPKPPNVPGGGYVTNVRNTTSSFWKPWLKEPSVKVGNDVGGRCLVPVVKFAEPDKNTGMKTHGTPSVNRWFARPDGSLFAFAGIWRTWTGDRGTKTKPDVGQHRLYSFLTTDPAAVVKPIHEKATPLILTTKDEIETWLTAPMDEALKLQQPARPGVIVLLPLEPRAEGEMEKSAGKAAARSKAMPKKPPANKKATKA